MKYWPIFKEEVYKIFIKKHFLLIFVCFIIFDVASFNLEKKSTSFNSVVSESMYLDQIAQLKGVYNENTGNKIQEKAIYTRNYYDDLLDLRIDTTTNEYQDRIKAYPLIYTSIDVYNLLDSQINFVKESPSRRFLLNTSAWERLITDQFFEYGIVLLAIIMATSVYCGEYSSRVDVLNRSSYLGRISRYLIQTCIMILSMAIIIMVIYTLRYFSLYSLVKGTGKFPAQSLPSFGNMVYNLSILQTFGAVIVLRLVGIITVFSFTALVSTVTKSTLTSFFISIVITFVPLLTMSLPQIYKYPLPATWFKATGLIQGESIIEIYKNWIPDTSPSTLLTLFSILVVFLIASWTVNIKMQRKGQ